MANNDSSISDGECSEKKIKLGIQSCHNTHSKCIVCKKAKKLKRVSVEVRCQVFIERGLFVPNGARCCQKHFDENKHLEPDALQCITVVANHVFANDKALTDLLNIMRKKISRRGINFDDPSALSDDDYYRLTGVHKKDFDVVAAKLKDHIRSTQNRSHRSCLGMILMKLRTGLSLSVLSTLFCIEKSRVSRAIKVAREALVASFVPEHLGITHITREDVIANHTTPIAKTLFGSGDENCVLVAGGTYIYIEKSSNYSFQRHSFSVHKGRPLLKPMMLVTTTGYIVEMFGPYFADGKNNDANILTSLMIEDTSALRKWLEPQDVFVVDRGFRDCLGLLESLGFVTKMPYFLENASQHSWYEANESRLVTKIRWVVEAVNGLCKQWKMFSHVFPNSQIPFIGQYVRIVCALCNAFRPPRVSNRPDDILIAQRMMRLALQPNKLQQTVEQEGWARKRVCWKPLEANDLHDFPVFTVHDLREITFGCYQLKQAKSYTEEHLAQDGMYNLFVHKESTNVLRVKIQSRHTSSKEYSLWVQFNTSQSSVDSWYCQCKCGARTVGCCAHVASVLWYLGYYRHLEDFSPRPALRYNEYVADAASQLIEDDVDIGWTEENESD